MTRIDNGNRAHQPASQTPAVRSLARSGPSPHPENREVPAIASDIDLTVAHKAVGISPERRTWLAQMQEPDGMNPGPSARAHARAFTFADALRSRGYRVDVGPYGPRGGRRFLLTGYAGPRADAIPKLQKLRGCAFDHSGDDCTCFDSLTDQQISDVARLLRLANRPKRGRRYTSSEIAALVRTRPLAVLNTAAALHVTAHGTSNGGPDLQELVDLLARHDSRAVEVAVDVFSQAGGTRTGSAPVAELAAALAVALVPKPGVD